MERRDFLMASALMTTFTGVAQHTFEKETPLPLGDAIKPVLLNALPPLDHKGGMDIRVWMRSSMTKGLFSSVECAVAHKTMGPHLIGTKNSMS
ncbi:MAG: hypothetical protein R2822_21055 [Spirosomataceae bacterium]